MARENSRIRTYVSNKDVADDSNDEAGDNDTGYVDDADDDDDDDAEWTRSEVVIGLGEVQRWRVIGRIVFLPRRFPHSGI